MVKKSMEKERFAIADALLYLKEQGWKIKRSKLYDDKDLIGYQIIENVITFKRSDLDEYAKKFLRPVSNTKTDSGIYEKIIWETKIAKEKYKKLKFESAVRRGKYILRSEVEHMLAARAAFLKSNLGADYIHSRAPKIVEIVRGDVKYIPDLIDYWLKQISEVFDYYAKPIQFDVPLIQMDDEEEEEDDDDDEE